VAFVVPTFERQICRVLDFRSKAGKLSVGSKWGLLVQM